MLILKNILLLMLLSFFTFAYAEKVDIHVFSDAASKNYKSIVKGKEQYNVVGVKERSINESSKTVDFFFKTNNLDTKKLDYLARDIFYFDTFNLPKKKYIQKYKQYYSKKKLTQVWKNAN